MIQIIEAVFDGKVLRPEEPIDLEPNMRVVITIDTDMAIRKDGDDSERGREPVSQAALYHLHERARPTGISDLADQHDHYLYGSPL